MFILTHSSSLLNMGLSQVEFLIEGYLLPLTMVELRVSENLLLHQASPRESPSWLSPSSPHYTLAYVCVDTTENANYHPVAASYLGFFLMVYTLVSGLPVTARMGVGTPLDRTDSLGKNKISFPSVEKIVSADETQMDNPFNNLILKAKDQFLQLLPDRQQIMSSYLGLALRYYYHAVRASKRWSEGVIINSMIACEALLIVAAEKKRGSLARRLSSLIAEDKTEQTQISKKMRELWDLRCAIVHSGRKRSSLNDAELLLDYARKAIGTALSLRPISKKELAEKLDREAKEDI